MSRKNISRRCLKKRKNVIKKVSDKSRKNMSIEVVKSQEKLRKV